MILAVASGKGGTGKTLVSTNLAWCLAQAGHEVTYVDTDVEAPNGHLFLRPEGVQEGRLSVSIPTLANGRCSGCGACQNACAFNAIIALKDKVMVLAELCHSCGACVLSCDERSLTETTREIGTVRRGESERVSFLAGVLDVGEAKAPPLIDGLLGGLLGGLLKGSGENHKPDEGCVILDAPPGTSCNAITVVRKADHVLLVTEPTPFGLHDLKLAVSMCRALGKPVSAVINRSDLGDREVARWLSQEGIEVLCEIPFSQKLASVYAKADLAAKEIPSLRQSIAKIARTAIGWSS